ncbi:protein NDR1 [Capsicum annuum]|uniref:protein NDR1 n=1 Tax=Capsicum annuum TaxID=4072 RepID=UPI0007BFB643|nr:protein NDR1 [Capsicum annuum]
MSDYDFSSSRTSCACHCVKLIVSLGVLALILWLSLRTTKPKCSIGDVYVRGLDKSVNSNNNMTRRDNHVSFQLNLKNEMKDKSIRYNDITLNFYYGTNTSYPIGNYTFDGFKQGKDKEASKSGMIEAHNMPWDDAIKAVSNGSKATFRVDIEVIDDCLVLSKDAKGWRIPSRRVKGPWQRQTKAKEEPGEAWEVHVPKVRLTCSSRCQTVASTCHLRSRCAPYLLEQMQSGLTCFFCYK